jgi:hypothetical protein
MKRRTFLQRIGSILAVLGLTEAEWLTLGNRYYQALAQPNSRRLALLVGINQYTESLALGGCLTDVELQRELLIHRFGFLAPDILTLTEEQASREFIEAAILDHLHKQAKAGDVVVFHFSGYGTRVKLESLPEMQNVLVSANPKSQDKQFVNYLLVDTLLLLLRSLPTDQVRAVLDTSHYAPSKLTPAGWQIRTFPEFPEAQLAAAELEFLQSLKNQSATLNDAVILAATATPQQVARELRLSGVSAGLFTHTLTQYLWEITPPRTIQFTLSHVGSSMSRLGNQQEPKLLHGKKNASGSVVGDPVLLDSTGAEGVVKTIEEAGKTAQVWLAGLPAQVLENYGVNSQLTCSTGQQLVVRSRSGLTAKVQISNPADNIPLQVGQLVQEEIRVLPRNISLVFALDTGLERIERVDATSAFAGFFSALTVVAGEQPADYVFGKLQQNPSRYGLFSLGGEPILNTVGEAGEAVKVAVQRLSAKYGTLLAAKFWRLIENAGSSRLAVKASLELVTQIAPRVVMVGETMRTRSLAAVSQSTSIRSGLIPQIPVGSRIQYRVQNLSDRPIYLILVGLNNNRTAIAFYPWQIPTEANISSSKPQLKEIVIPPGETLVFPQTVANAGWLVTSPAVFCENQLICSTAPFSQTMLALAAAKYPTADQQPVSSLVNPLEVAQALLQDLHNASAKKADINGTKADTYILDVHHWASLNFSFQVL